MRSLAALLVLVVLVGGVVVAAEVVARSQVRAVVTAVAADELQAGPASDVAVDVEGPVLLGLLRSRFDAVTVRAGDVRLGWLPVRSLEVTARGTSPDARRVEQVAGTVRADAAGLLDALVPSGDAGWTAEATAPDRVVAAARVPAPGGGGTQQVTAELRVRADAGELLVEPLEVVGTDGSGATVRVPTARLGSLGDGVSRASLPGGLQVRTATVEPGGPGAAGSVVVLELGCDGACALR